MTRAGGSLTLLLAVLALAALTGCPGGPTESDTERVLVGQRWRFVQGGLPESEQVYRVTAVSATVVGYEVQGRVGGEDVGEAVPLTFSRDPAPEWPGGAGVEAELSVSGHALPCRVYERADGSHTWTAGREWPEFPGVLMASEDGQVILELVEILPPD